MTLLEHDTMRMREALALAELGWGLTRPNPMVGALLEKDGEIIGRGFHRVAGEAHAEINALRDARARGNDPAGATLYVTLEPCSTYGRTPPCTEAILEAKISRVVAALNDPNPRHAGRGIEILRRAGVETTTGILSAECGRLNAAFFKFITSKKPFVMLKLAVTLDGRIATASGDSQYVTGEEARKRVQKLRRLADAVIVGAETARFDHPRLTVREPADWPHQPLRLIASSSMDEEELQTLFPDGNAGIVDLSSPEKWDDFLVSLGEKKMTALLIEGGGELAASALRAKAVDYAEFHIAPKILGGKDARPAVAGESPETMAEALALRDIRHFSLGDDLIVTGFLK
ncbi:MAG: bifunctional diaminohydroxyphosphoribosylaminopyrimidine deaminase/5-amino-6-(5-phosphoribosylamino)uracil reductase RibD [Victivallaceae bacterium]|nr:bifunctional diaminohydroxyphosphoribosylaminopyrimidine deaminase/5-amino-6-(5-phosphoribosylamino)uracil reductase RibD [Victivallaceae bacterium]